VGEDALREKIITWATEEDFEVHIETPPKNAPLDWVLRLTSKVPATVNVIVQKPRGKESQIIVSLGVMISEQHYNGLSGLPEKKRAEVVYEIIRDLTLLCPDCLVLVQPSIVDFQRLLITRTLYTGETTRSVLMKTVKTMINAFALLSIRLSSLFGPMPGKSRKPDESLGFI